MVSINQTNRCSAWKKGCIFAATTEATKAYQGASDGLVIRKRSSQLVEDLPTYSIMMPFDLHDLGDGCDTELYGCHHIYASIATCSSNADIFISHCFQEVSDEMLKFAWLHLPEAIPEGLLLVLIEDGYISKENLYAWDRDRPSRRTRLLQVL